MELRFEIRDIDFILSENVYLAAGVKKVGNRSVPYLYKKTEVRTYQDQIINDLCAQSLDIIKESMETYTNSFIDNRVMFKAEWEFYVTNIWGRDLTNMKKLAEDAIVTFLNKKCGLKFDDSQIFEDTNKKFESEKEFIILKLSVMEN